MTKRTRGLILAGLGVMLFVAAILALLYVQGLYLASLLMLFVSVVLIGVGTAFIKGVDGSMDLPSDDCYYCKGTGMIAGIDGNETCPRCAGTGLARADD